LTTDRVGVLYDPRMAEHRDVDDPKHPEQPLRIVRIFEWLEAEGLASRCVRIPCREATREELVLKHTEAHVDAMFRIASLDIKDAVREGRNYNSVYLVPESTLAATLSAGSVVEATSQVCTGQVRSAICVVRPPGHHAECGCAMGFCLFGNVAVAAAEAQRQGWSRKTLIVDWDVHHGNGTQRMFESDDKVLYFSVHRYDNGNFYPGGRLGHYSSHGSGAGAGYSVNVPWEVRRGQIRGAPAPGDAEFLDSFERVLLPIAEAFQPDLVLVSAGFDSAEGDPLGGCRVSPAGFYELTRRLMAVAQGRLVLALEGGYNLRSISASMAACAHALLGDPLPGHSSGTLRVFGPPDAFHEQTVTDVRRHLSRFWPSLHDEVLDITGTADASSSQAVDRTQIPAVAFQGGLFQMQLALRDYAQETGQDFEELRKKHEAILFKLDKKPATTANVAGKRRRAEALKQSFLRVSKSGPYLVPTVHATTAPQVQAAVDMAQAAGAHGVWLAQRSDERSDERSDDTSPPDTPEANLSLLAECFATIRTAFPDLWIGLRIPQLSAVQVFAWVQEKCTTADAVWLENLPCKAAEVTWETLGFGELAQHRAVRNERWLSPADQPALEAVRLARRRSNWLGLVFAGIARQSDDPIHHDQDNPAMSEACRTLLQHCAALARFACDVVVTSVPARGEIQTDTATAHPKLLALAASGPVACTWSSLGAFTSMDAAAVDVVLADTAIVKGKPGSTIGLEMDEAKLRQWVCMLSEHVSTNNAEA